MGFPDQPAQSKKQQDKEKEQTWREGFEAQAQDAESMDVEYALLAQAEIILDNDD